MDFPESQKSVPDSRRGEDRLTDEEAIRRLGEQFAQREPRAFDEVFRLFRETVYVIGIVELGDPEEAEDLVQETFRRAWTSARTLGDPTRLRSWLYAIARNQLADQARKVGRRPLLLDLDAQRELLARRSERKEETPVDALAQREAAACVRRLLSTVPDQFRLVLALRLMEEMSYQEIAAQLDLPLHAVKNAIARGGRILVEKIRNTPSLVPESGLALHREKGASS